MKAARGAELPTRAGGALAAQRPRGDADQGRAGRQDVVRPARYGGAEHRARRGHPAGAGRVLNGTQHEVGRRRREEPAPGDRDLVDPHAIEEERGSGAQAERRQHQEQQPLRGVGRGECKQAQQRCGGEQEAAEAQCERGEPLRQVAAGGEVERREQQECRRGAVIQVVPTVEQRQVVQAVRLVLRRVPGVVQPEELRRRRQREVEPAGGEGAAEQRVVAGPVGAAVQRVAGERDAEVEREADEDRGGDACAIGSGAAAHRREW